MLDPWVKLGFEIQTKQRKYCYGDIPNHPKLTPVPRVIHDILDVVGRPQGSYAERFVSISLLLADI